METEPSQMIVEVWGMASDSVKMLVTGADGKNWRRCTDRASNGYHGRIEIQPNQRREVG